MQTHKRCRQSDAEYRSGISTLTAEGEAADTLTDNHELGHYARESRVARTVSCADNRPWCHIYVGRTVDGMAGIA